MVINDPDYKHWLTDLKNKIRSVQIKAAIIVNSALIHFYWDLGRMISEKQTVWGVKFVETLSRDLQKEFPDLKGFSRRNLYNARQFYEFYKISFVQQAVAQFDTRAPRNTQNIDVHSNNDVQSGFEMDMQQLFAQIPWGHNLLIVAKCITIPEARFYVEQTIYNNWSRDTLAWQIKSNLYARNGKAVSNFKNTLPDPLSDLAQQTLKDPYIFNFMTLESGFREKDIEKQLVDHITRFLLELGKGFAFVGQQYHLEIAENDYYIDLLFYHIKLKCYVVIELKNTRFMPEYAGKLNFYLSAVDSLIKDKDDKPTIGILLCKDKNNIEADFALRDINKPIGVSEFQITEHLPDNLKSSLPTIEEIENELKNLVD
jgi:predicted nuclease of restriction endonuclease-like (RecB) superfamily